MQFIFKCLFFRIKWEVPQLIEKNIAMSPVTMMEVSRAKCKLFQSRSSPKVALTWLCSPRANPILAPDCSTCSANLQKILSTWPGHPCTVSTNEKQWKRLSQFRDFDKTLVRKKLPFKLIQLFSFAVSILCNYFTSFKTYKIITLMN